MESPRGIGSRLGVTIGGIIFTALACANPAADPEPLPQSEPLPSSIPVVVSVTPDSVVVSPPSRSAQIDELLPQVSQENLAAHVTRLAAIPTRHVNSAGIGRAAQLIHDEFVASGGRLDVTYEDFSLGFDGLPTTQLNVVATLPGTRPESGVIVVGAHYDSRTVDITDASSRAPGADDNATGVAALIEMARLLSAEQPAATVVFVAFSAEEVGMVGSTHFVETSQTLGVQLSAMMQLDIIGNARGQAGEGAIRVFSAPPDGSPSRQLARYVALYGETYLPGFDVDVQATVDRPGRYSDHVPFSEAGVPSVRLIEVMEDAARQHSEFDTPDSISPGYLRRATQLTLASVYGMAFGPPALSAPILQSRDTISWSPVEGATGYALLFREPESQNLGEVVRIGPSTTLTWDQLATGRYAAVSVAAIDADGLIGFFSPELALSNQR